MRIVIPVVDFVLGSFDYKEPNFTENRSKHRNDLVTMKKLREAGGSSSNKKAPKSSSKEKVDDSGRSHPPKV